MSEQAIPPILQPGNIVTGLASEPTEAVIRRCGQMLLDAGYVPESYIDSMVRRNEHSSVSIGNRIAIPHGEDAAKASILATGLVILTYPDGIDWDGDGNLVQLVVGIAAKGDEHVEFLAKIAEEFEEVERVEQVVAHNDAALLYNLLKVDE
jgi:mannitol/fructose-specific phosphotransferase system IIA component